MFREVFGLGYGVWVDLELDLLAWEKDGNITWEDLGSTFCNSFKNACRSMDYLIYKMPH